MVPQSVRIEEGGSSPSSTSLVRVRRRDLENGHIEALWSEVKLTKTHLLVCNVYRPPNATGKAEWTGNLAEMIKCSVLERKSVIMMQWRRKDSLIGGAQFETTHRVVSNLYNNS